ncbi:MAG: phosphate/phosphite/phosphonate ABC transporter substrate-binding protein [Planctomycetes bacterium]|nr:phosphate/phosphite/phosphonate ABC transporter substrate-binding protein [Planctomycetota bacterium]MBI3844970.1 phosphate/phosphite/phosphonate ABC transporter substrate-binding protein [Planctomycetota bacterium]
MNRRQWLATTIVLGSALLLGIATRPASPSEPKADAPAGIRVFHFGVYTSEKATEMYTTFAPILETAADFLSTTLKSRIDFEIEVGRNYDASIQDLAGGKVDFARFGPASYITAKSMEPGLQIVAMEVKDGQKTFDGVVVTKKSSPIQSLADLKGKTFAFGDKNSTIGRYLAQEALAKAGVHRKDLAKSEYIDRHDRVASAVLHAEFDAGAVKEDTYLKMKEKDEGLREIARLRNVTKPWLARRGLDPAIIEGLRAFLLQYKDQTALKRLEGMTGFAVGDDADFDSIRAAMSASELFDRE